VPLSALLLALAAAVLHALWNVLIARSRDPEAATAVALVAAAVAFAPVAVLTWDVGRDAWPYVVASAALELAYFALLAAAYRRSELGLIYPLARGLAPVFVLVAAAVVVGTDPSVGQVVGVAAIAAGVLLVRGVGRRADGRGTLFAAVIAACIAAYTLVDKEGIEHASAVAYLELVLVPVALVAVVSHAATGRAGRLRAELGPSSLAAGAGSFAAYAFALAALALAPAAAVAAVRETGILFAVALGVVVLREPVGRPRATGAALIVGGVALVALG